MTLTLTLCFFTSSIFAQVDNGDDNLVNLDTIMTYNPLDMARIADSCRYPMVVNAATVRYQSSARVLLEFGGDFIPSAFTLQSLSTSMTVPYQLFPGNNSIVLNNLVLNNQYVVVATNSCGVSGAAYVINTSKPTEPSIFVSDKMMDALNDQIKNHSNTPFYTYLVTRTDLPLLERAAFIQSYFLDDDLIPNIYVNMLPPVAPNRHPFCRCKEVRGLPFADKATHTGNWEFSGNLVPIQTDNVNSKTSLGKNCRSWFARDYYGAGKYAQQWAEGYKATKGINHVDSMTYKATNLFRLRITLYCNDGGDLPADCLCPKPIQSFYKYDTQAKSQSEIKGGWSSASRAAFNITQDVGVFTSLNERTGDVKIINATTAKAATNCDYAINPDYWNNYIDLLGSVANAITTDTINYPNLIDTLSDQLKKIINTSLIVPATCINGNTVSKDMNGIGNHILVANQPLRLTLSSHDRIVSGGKRSWGSSGRVLSNGYIATFLPGGRLLPTDDTLCCTPKASSWILSGAADGYNPVPFLRSDVGNLISLYGWSFPPSGAVPTDFGKVWSPSTDPVCSQIIYRESHSSELQNQIFISILDLTGKIVIEEYVDLEFSKNYQNQLNLRYNYLTPGMYFAILTASNGKRLETIKLVISK